MTCNYILLDLSQTVEDRLLARDLSGRPRRQRWTCRWRSVIWAKNCI